MRAARPAHWEATSTIFCSMSVANTLAMAASWSGGRPESATAAARNTSSRATRAAASRAPSSSCRRSSSPTAARMASNRAQVLMNRSSPARS